MTARKFVRGLILLLLSGSFALAATPVNEPPSPFVADEAHEALSPDLRVADGLDRGHVSAVERSGLTGLREGQAVSFDVENDPRKNKPSAVNIKPV